MSASTSSAKLVRRLHASISRSYWNFRSARAISASARRSACSRSKASRCECVVSVVLRFTKSVITDVITEMMPAITAATTAGPMRALQSMCSIQAREIRVPRLDAVEYVQRHPILRKTRIDRVPRGPLPGRLGRTAPGSIGPPFSSQSGRAWRRCRRRSSCGWPPANGRAPFGCIPASPARCRRGAGSPSPT
jgi:hypothetical protein